MAQLIGSMPGSNKRSQQEQQRGQQTERRIGNVRLIGRVANAADRMTRAKATTTKSGYCQQSLSAMEETRRSVVEAPVPAAVSKRLLLKAGFARLEVLRTESIDSQKRLEDVRNEYDPLSTMLMATSTRSDGDSNSASGGVTNSESSSENPSLIVNNDDSDYEYDFDLDEDDFEGDYESVASAESRNSPIERMLFNRHQYQHKRSTPSLQSKRQ